MVKIKIKEKVVKVITINGCNKINPNRLIINGISQWKQEMVKLQQICGEHKIWKFRPVSLAGAINKKINKKKMNKSKSKRRIRGPTLSLLRLRLEDGVRVNKKIKIRTIKLEMHGIKVIL